MVKAPTEVLTLLTKHGVWAKLQSAMRESATTIAGSSPSDDLTDSLYMQATVLELFGLVTSAALSTGHPQTLPAQLLRSPGMLSATLHGIGTAAKDRGVATRQAGVRLATQLLEFLARVLSAYEDLHKHVWDFVLPEVRIPAGTLPPCLRLMTSLQNSVGLP